MLLFPALPVSQHCQGSRYHVRVPAGFGATIGLITSITQLFPCYLLHGRIYTSDSTVLFLIVRLAMSFGLLPGMHLTDKDCEVLHVQESDRLASLYRCLGLGR
jgi:hypothetical protein